MSSERLETHRLGQKQLRKPFKKQGEGREEGFRPRPWRAPFGCPVEGNGLSSFETLDPAFDNKDLGSMKATIHGTFSGSAAFTLTHSHQYCACCRV